MTLADKGFALGDLVTYSSSEQSTGGVIFQISKNREPQPAFDHTGKSVPPVPLEGYRSRYEIRHTKVYRRDGKKMPKMDFEGYVRLTPFFEFFSTSWNTTGVDGKVGNVLVYHRDLAQAKKVELVTMGIKYVELGNLLRELAIKGGWEPPAVTVQEG